MPTLQDVAQRAGVSIATVSKVLSNRPYFTEETRDKVMQAVRELGYTPNIAARALSSGRTSVIGIVFPHVFDTIFKDPLTMHILEGIEAECNRRNYNMLLSTPRVTENGPDEQYRQLVQSGYMDGMIALDNVPLASVLAPVDQSRTPVVVIGYRSAEYSVHSDDRGGGEALIRHVLELGHRRIGIITVPSNMNYALNERMNAIRHVIEEAGIDFHSIPVAYGDFSTKGGAAMTELLLWQRPDLTAVVCLTDRMALGAIQKLHEMGYNVPDDITVVGYDNIAMSEVVNPALTTISQEPTAIGAAAARMLFAVLQGHKPTPAVLPIRLIVRESSAVPRE